MDWVVIHLLPLITITFSLRFSRFFYSIILDYRPHPPLSKVHEEEMTCVYRVGQITEENGKLVFIFFIFFYFFNLSLY